MKIKITFLLFSCLLFAINSDAQNKRKRKTEKPTSSETQKKSTVIVFGDDEVSEEEAPSNKKEIVIKTSPTSFIFGSSMIEVEKELTSALSAQIGLGITFKNFGSGLFDELLEEEIFDEQVSDNWSLGNDIYDYYTSDRITRLGYLFSFIPKIYYDSDGFDGGYIAPVFKFKRNKFDVEQILEGQRDVVRTPNNYDSEKEDIIDILVRSGYQNLVSSITFESFAGIGIRFVNEYRQDLGYSSFGEVSRAFQNRKYSRLNFELGLRIGYYF